MLQPGHRPLRLSFDQSLDFLEFLKNDTQFRYEPDAKRGVLVAYDKQQERVFEFRLPLPLPDFNEEESLHRYLERTSRPDVPPDYIIILIQAGHSALAYCEAGKMLYHKVIRKYMVRKKQGKAQIAHLKSKGKSRAGSRVRLAQTVEFFEEINSKLHNWDVTESADRILYSCPVRMWPLLFESKVPAPFDQRDNKLRKIPMDVGIPNLEELEEVNRFALSGAVTVYKPFELAFFN
jgi:hypothetical protein